VGGGNGGGGVKGCMYSVYDGYGGVVYRDQTM
jgi:hypothetical protein